MAKIFTNKATSQATGNGSVTGSQVIGVRRLYAPYCIA